MSTPPRMRTIKEVMQELKKIDPNTAVREYYVRELVNTNKIAHLRAGRKILVNFDAFLEYLQNPTQIDVNNTTSIEVFKNHRIAR